jgi:hypothetical protein
MIEPEIIGKKPEGVSESSPYYIGAEALVFEIREGIRADAWACDFPRTE